MVSSCLRALFFWLSIEEPRRPYGLVDWARVTLEAAIISALSLRVLGYI